MEFVRIISNRKFVISVISILLLNTVFLFFFEYRDIGYTGVQSLADYKKIYSNCDLSAYDSVVEAEYERIDALLKFVEYGEAKIEDPEFYDIFYEESEAELRRTYPDLAMQYDEAAGKLDINLLNLEKDIYGAEIEKRDYISGYNDYVNELISNARDLNSYSIFNNSFSKRSIEKSIQAYERNLNAELSLTNTSAFEHTIMGYTTFVTVIVQISFCILMCVTLFFNKDNNVNIVIRSSKNGRISLFLKQTAISSLLIFVFSAVTFISNYLLYGIFYGFDLNWQADIRSSMLFKDFTYGLSFTKFAILYVIVNALVLILIYLILYFIVQLSSGINIFALIAIMVTAAEAVLYNLIPTYSVFSTLHVANLLFFINVENWIVYDVINFFGGVFQIEQVALFSIIVLSLAVFTVNLVVTTKRHAIKTKSKIGVFISKAVHSAKITLNKLMSRLFSNNIEVYKLLFSQKFLIVIIIICYVFVNGYTFGYVSKTPVEAYLSNFYESYSGELNKYTLEDIEVIRQEILDAQTDVEKAEADYEQGIITECEYLSIANKLGAYETVSKALRVIDNQIGYINGEIQNGHNAYLIYVDGYENLFGHDSIDTDGNHIILFLFLLLFLTLGLSSMDENKNISLFLRSTKKGRKDLLLRKLKVMYAFALALYLFSVLFRIFYTAKYFGIDNLLAPIQSIYTYSGFPLNINILTFIFIIYSTRFICYISILSIMLYLNMALKSKMALVINFAIFILPSLIKFLGVDLAERVSFAHILCFADNYSAENSYVMTYLIIVFALAVLSCISVAGSIKLSSKVRKN